jgi:hypothetical protein
MGHNTTTCWEGFKSPQLEGIGEAVQGDNCKAMRQENKQRRQILRAEQADKTQWSTHKVKEVKATATAAPELKSYKNSMCPMGRALHHPAAELLNEWALFGCPTNTG